MNQYVIAGILVLTSAFWSTRASADVPYICHPFTANNPNFDPVVKNWKITLQGPSQREYLLTVESGNTKIVDNIRCVPSARAIGIPGASSLECSDAEGQTMLALFSRERKELTLYLSWLPGTIQIQSRCE